jgi:hypothetical protein
MSMELHTEANLSAVFAAQNVPTTTVPRIEEVVVDRGDIQRFVFSPVLPGMPFLILSFQRF